MCQEDARKHASIVYQFQSIYLLLENMLGMLFIVHHTEILQADELPPPIDIEWDIFDALETG